MASTTSTCHADSSESVVFLREGAAEAGWLIERTGPFQNEGFGKSITRCSRLFVNETGILLCNFSGMIKTFYPACVRGPVRRGTAADKKHPQRHCRAVLAHVQSAADAFYTCAFTGQCRPGPEWSFCRPRWNPASRAPGSIPSGYPDRRLQRCGASAVCRWFHRRC